MVRPPVNSDTIDPRTSTTGRRRLIILLACVAVLSLAVASYVDTCIEWHNWTDWPSGPWTVSLLDQSGQPVRAARIESGFPGRDRDEGFFAGHMFQEPAGTLMIERTDRAASQSGYSWELFWVIPMGRRPGDFSGVRITIRADGYEAASIEAGKLPSQPSPIPVTMRRRE